MSTFSPNLNLEEVARGGDVGVWDTPTNSNWAIADSALGNIAAIPLNNSNVVLSATQFQSKQITFNSTLTGSVIITFPTSFTKSYEIQNLCTGSSAFLITLETTATGGQVIVCPPGETVTIFNDGTNLKFTNLGRIGTYVDYAGGGVPTWITNCTVPPYLDCNGQTFSAATYPVLAIILGSTTVPDFRGRNAYYLNEGTGRLTSAGAGINGDSNFTTGGSNGVTLGTSNLPTLSAANTITVSATAGFVPAAATGLGLASVQLGTPVGGANNFAPVTGGGSWVEATALSGSNTITVNTNASPQVIGATAPGIVSGVRLIRAG